jgi:DNA-binding transcriptional MerR regulator
MLVRTSKAKKNSLSSAKRELPPIPNKIYFTIGEISNLCDLDTHVLRYWEQEFTQLKPLRRRGNRRYYQQKEVLLVRQIRSLLYEQGYTIEGAKAQLANININRSAVPDNDSNGDVKSLLNKVTSSIEQIIADLNQETT